MQKVSGFLEALLCFACKAGRICIESSVQRARHASHNQAVLPDSRGLALGM